jgi:hypothetical protein
MWSQYQGPGTEQGFYCMNFDTTTDTAIGKAGYLWYFCDLNS